LDLGWEQFTIDRLEYWGRVSLLKGGINDADIVTTVSRRYAEGSRRRSSASALKGSCGGVVPISRAS